MRSRFPHVTVHLAAQSPSGISAQVTCSPLDRDPLSIVPFSSLPAETCPRLPMSPPLCSCHLGGRMRTRRRSAWFRQQCDAPSPQASHPQPFSALSFHSPWDITDLEAAFPPCVRICKQVHTEIYLIRVHTRHVGVLMT